MSQRSAPQRRSRRESEPPTTVAASRPWRNPWWLGGLLVLFVLVGLAVWNWVDRRTAMADSRARAVPQPAPIDGNRAFGYLKAICDLGPRPAGSEANDRQRAMVAAHFRALGATVREQPFTAEHPLDGSPIAMANLIGSWFPERTERVLIGAHYDTRPFPDEERDPAKRRQPFLGANDGASGVALLMEIAHHLNDFPTPWGVDLVLFDGEELVYGRTGEYCLGSKEFARQYDERQRQRRKDASESRYVAGIILDMVGGRDLRIDQEQYSLHFAPRLVREVWSVAAQLEAKGFRNRVGQAVVDDHLPLNNVGIPSIDLIDFNFVHWHTVNDTPENCSPDSLEQVGRVVTGWLSLPQPPERRR